MFAVIKILENKKDFFSRLKFKFNPPKPEIKRINVPSAAPFYYLEIYESQCGKDFNEVAYILGRSSKYLIPCGKYQIPETPLIGIFRPERLPQLLLINSAADFLDKLNYDKTSFTVGIIDPKGEYADCAEKFADRACGVRIFTDFPERYENAAEYLFESRGISVVIAPLSAGAGGCDMLISPETNKNRLLNRTVVLYAGEDGKSEIYGAGEYNLPPEYKKIMPDGVNELVFACALYELCGARALRENKYSSLVRKEYDGING